MGLWVRWVATWGAAPPVRAPGRRARPRGAQRGWVGWLIDPRNAVVLALAAVLLLGGGRRWLQARRARRAVDRLDDPSVTPETVEAVAEHRRAGLMELFRVLGTAPEPAVRDAAGRALAVLWARDDLIPEEEKAIVRRGYAASWRARRRYPRGLRATFPIRVSYGVPFLRDDGKGVSPAQLEWSHRIVGAQRAGLEVFSPWRAGPGEASFELEPGDFPANGPHKLILQARVRTKGLTSTWELDLPHIPFSFEFDPGLSIDALLTLPDEARANSIAHAVRLEPSVGEEDDPRHLALNENLVLRDPPELAIASPLPCDLAHALCIEFEGVEGRFPAGEVILSGQGTTPEAPPTIRAFPLGPVGGLTAKAIERPGEHRLRAILTADPHLGWSDPDVRSIWPGTLTTEWVAVRLIRS
jgi:hypothetical protein